MKRLFFYLDVDERDLPLLGDPDTGGVPIVLDAQNDHYEPAKLTPVPELTPENLGLIAEALDSHVYWQLSDQERRDSGYVMEPHTNEEAAAIALQEQVAQLILGDCP